jgi:ABC-2 type transport system ATP-binding protein
MVGLLYGMSRRQARRGATEVLERIGLVEAGDRQVRTYSGGMRRRLDLAASLVGRPRVLLLDEPTAGLDPASRRDLWALIGELVEGGTTVLLTTQYLEEADQLADRIAILDRGRLIGEGTGDQLKQRVGGGVLDLTVPDDDRIQALQALRTLGAENPTDDRHGRFVLPAPESSKTLTEALRRLHAANITLQAIFALPVGSSDSSCRSP